MDILLSKTGDIDFSGNDLRFTDSLRQKIQIRLRWFMDEWVYQPSFGMPYFQALLKKNYDLEFFKQKALADIRELDEVISVENFDMFADERKRTLLVVFEVKTYIGNVKGDVELGIGQ